MASTRLRPHVIDWGLAVFCILAALGAAYSVWNGEIFWSGGPSPYEKYDGNRGIRLINAAALIVDLGVAMAVAAWWTRPVAAPYLERLVVVLCVVGASLTWTELWYGSTFYYGEVRDKQGLPLGINNGGALGSYIFLAYALWRGLAPAMSRGTSFLAGVLLLIALWVVHVEMLSLMEKPWNLYQS